MNVLSIQLKHNTKSFTEHTRNQPQSMNMSYVGEPLCNISELNFWSNSNRIINEKILIEPKAKQVLSNDDAFFMNCNGPADDTETREADAMTTKNDDKSSTSDK
jgi:hypothetical protein